MKLRLNNLKKIKIHKIKNLKVLRKRRWVKKEEADGEKNNKKKKNHK
jgi:hypothetical protein